MSRHKFCSRRVSYSRDRCRWTTGSSTSSSLYEASAVWKSCSERAWYALATAFIASTPIPGASWSFREQSWHHQRCWTWRKGLQLRWWQRADTVQAVCDSKNRMLEPIEFWRLQGIIREIRHQSLHLDSWWDGCWLLWGWKMHFYHCWRQKFQLGERFRVGMWNIPAYLRPALEEMMLGTSSASDVMTLVSSMYFKAITAFWSSRALRASKASRK